MFLLIYFGMLCTWLPATYAPVHGFLGVILPSLAEAKLWALRLPLPRLGQQPYRCEQFPWQRLMAFNKRRRSSNQSLYANSCSLKKFGRRTGCPEC